MLMTESMFYKRMYELIKRDDSYFSVICQIMSDFELDGEDVGEWIKDEPTIIDNIKAEFGIKCDINNLF